MTAATDTATAITGITEEQLAALQNGGWGDDTDGDGRPGWRRAAVPVEADADDDAEAEADAEDKDDETTLQWVGLSEDGRWESLQLSLASTVVSDSQRNYRIGRDTISWDSFDEMLVWCDEQVRGAKPAKPSSATKQEDRFALMAAAS